MSEGFKDYVEQRAMTDHAHQFHGCIDHGCIYLEGKPRRGIGTNGGCRCDPRPLLRDMQQRITQAHAQGRREAFTETGTEMDRRLSRIPVNGRPFSIDVQDFIWWCREKAKETGHE